MEKIRCFAMFLTMSSPRKVCFSAFFSMSKIALVLFFVTLVSAPAYGQSLIDGSVGTGTVLSSGQSAQIAFPSLDTMFNPGQLLVFALDCIIVLAISSAIVFHPVRIRARRNVRDLELPRLFLMYGLIGMAIGFLVLQYGAVIGFVIFGIGGLLRFRSVIRNLAWLVRGTQPATYCDSDWNIGLARDLDFRQKTQVPAIGQTY